MVLMAPRLGMKKGLSFLFDIRCEGKMLKDQLLDIFSIFKKFYLGILEGGMSSR